MAMNNQKQKFSRTIWDDFRRGDLKRTLRKDLKEIYSFYLDDETKQRLKTMSRFRRWIYMVFWLLKSLILKLTPARRVLLVLSLITFFVSHSNIGNDNINTSNNLIFLGFLGLLIILALELKDKLLAQDELAAGRAVQFALMPEKNPKLSGWDLWLFTQPANEVGGDLVDYIKFRDNNLGLVLGDVAGKGLGAALYMAKMQASIRALAPGYKSLAELGAHLNEIFYEDKLSNRFVSLIYLLLEPDSGQVRFVNAGHLPPIHIRSSSCKELPRGDPALGIKSNSNYNEQRLKLNQNEMLLLYSDGLTEARNEQGEFFGENRFLRLVNQLSGLSVESAGKKLINEVDKFVGEARPNDDLSLILMKCLTK